MQTSARKPRREDKRILIPGYPHLKAFSRDYETLIKEATGGAWRSYVQRGHWRMVFPFSREHQENTANRLEQASKSGSPAVVHVVDFPGLNINHAVVVFSSEEREGEIWFEIYDPNQASSSRNLVYNPEHREFTFPANNYFPGGKVNIYEVYCGAVY